MERAEGGGWRRGREVEDATCRFEFAAHRATRKTPSTAMSLTVDIVLEHNIVAMKRGIV